MNTRKSTALSNSLLAKLRERLAEKDTKSPVRSSIPEREPAGSALLSFAQQRMWFLAQLQPNSSLYNVSHAYRLHGKLDTTALTKAVEAITLRHEILRTRFEVQDDDPVQVVTDETNIDIRTRELSGLGCKEQQKELQRLITREADTPFDLIRPPLMRVRLWRLDDSELVLQLTLHHIVTDGWSRGVLLRELGVLYAAALASQSSTLPALQIQYADYALWQRQQLNDGLLAQQVDYWREQLGGELAVLELPADRPRPPVANYRGACHQFSLPANLMTPLKALSQQMGATLFMVLLAAFKVLLFRYSGQTDLLVGSPIAGRTRRELEPLIGFFVNTLVLRTDLNGVPTFRQLVGRVRETALAAYEHQDLPFEKLVEELHPDRNLQLNRNPLFQVMFIFQNAPQEHLRLGEAKATPIPIGSETAKFDLTLSLIERDGQLHGILEYAADLFNADRIERMAAHFRRLLEGVLDAPDNSITDLPLLTAVERQQLLVDWNDTAVAYPREQTVQGLFEAQVKRSPDAVALVCADESLTYAELNRRANQLAHYLKSLAVGADTLVGLSVERSMEMVVGLLGILKAGGAYVPLDPSYPAERLALMLADTQLPVLVSEARLQQSLPATAAKIICLDSDWSTIAKHSETNPCEHPEPIQRAYVIYTSGSTGKPKGIQISHGALVNFLCSMAQRPGIDAADTMTAVTTLSFDISTLEVFLPLIAGARTVVVSREVAQDGSQLSKLLTDSKSNMMQATPATWQMLIDAGWQGSDTFKVLCGGEALSAELANQLKERALSVWNMYGPTETTVWSSVAEVDAEEGVIPIGRPIANTQLYILDSQLNPLPVGVPGELHIGGAGLANGYLHRPELTAEKFISNPFSEVPGSRLYKTGDLAQYRPDGNIEILGRIDYQVKLRGFRIELGEIEAVLRQHHAVQQAIVTVREDIPGDKRLVGYLVPVNHRLAVAELREFLGDKLPGYMVPSAFVELQRFPLMPNGKVNRLALPAPETTRDSLSASYTAPLSPTEVQLAGIWSQVLGIGQVGVNDNFFELGGHSLLATRVVSRINETFEIQLPLIRLFQLPQVGALSEEISKARKTAKKSALSPIRPISRVIRRPVASSKETDTVVDVTPTEHGGSSRK